MCGYDCNRCAYLCGILLLHKLLKSEASRSSVSRFCAARDAYWM